MKSLLKVSKGEHLAARVLRSLSVLVIAFGLVMALWTATVPMAEAQGNTPEQMLQSHLPPNTPLAKAGKGQLVAAVSAAVKSSARNVGEIVSVAARTRKGDVVDIVTAAIRALGREPDCDLVARAVEGGIEANAEKAAAIVEGAMRVAGQCAAQIQRVMDANREETESDEGQGNYGNSRGNQNPAPGSVGGGGGSQSGRCQVCHRSGNGKRRTLTISCNAVPAHVRHGDTEGPCPVTPTQNP